MNEVKARCPITEKQGRGGAQLGGEDRRKLSDYFFFLQARRCIEQILLITGRSKWNKSHMAGISSWPGKQEDEETTGNNKKTKKTTPETKNMFVMSKTSEKAEERPVLLALLICAIAYSKQTPCSLETADSRRSEGGVKSVFPTSLWVFFQQTAEPFSSFAHTHASTRHRACFHCSVPALQTVRARRWAERRAGPLSAAAPPLVPLL